MKHKKIFCEIFLHLFVHSVNDILELIYFQCMQRNTCQIIIIIMLHSRNDLMWVWNDKHVGKW